MLRRPRVLASCVMSRALAVVTACSCVVLCAARGARRHDRSERPRARGQQHELQGAARRRARAVEVASDARAVIALADALDKDDDATIRRVAALALEKMIDAHTPDDARAARARRARQGRGDRRRSEGARAPRAAALRCARRAAQGERRRADARSIAATSRRCSSTSTPRSINRRTRRATPPSA